MHPRYPSYSPPLEDSPPSTPLYKGKYGYHPRRQTPSLRRRRLLIVVPLFLFVLYISGFHLPRRKPVHAPSINHKNIVWSRYAYSLYATNQAYLCNAVVVFESLQRLGSKADRVLFFPEEWNLGVGNGAIGENGEEERRNPEGGDDRNAQLLEKARDWYDVNLVPVNKAEYAALVGEDLREGEEEGKSAEEKEEAKKRDVDDGDDHDKKKGSETSHMKKKKSGWEGSFMKFLAWGQTQYDRVLHLDADITLINHMDELFLLPSVPVAMMRAYWLLPSAHRLTSLFVLLEPSEKAFQRLMNAAKQVAKKAENRDWDMEILNRIYGDEALVLPHRGYGILTGEFRTHDHSNYLGSTGDEKNNWNAEKVLQQTMLVHFSDWPLPKPWIMWPHTLLPEIMPKCQYLDSGIVDNCKDKKVWTGLYDGFRKRRKEVCALLSAPAPEWPPKNGTLEDDWFHRREEEKRGKEKEYQL